MTSIVLNEQRTAAERTGRGIDILLGSSSTAGSLSLLECHVPAGTAGPPLHLHPRSDETFLVTSGLLLVRAGDQLFRLSPGELAHISRGTAHSFATAPSDDAHFYVVHTPGGFEEFHAAAAEAEQRNGAPVPTADLVALAARFDWQLAGPPLLPSGLLAGAS